MLRILQIYLSPGHNFFGRHGLAAGTHEMLRVDRVECVAGSGLRGDRFFDYKENYKGQVTLFAHETYLDLCSKLIPAGADAPPPSVFRRNILTEGADLNDLIGKTFTLQGVVLEGMAECSPCYWMNQAFAPGAEACLKGRGGLRARILKGGWLARDEGLSG